MSRHYTKAERKPPHAKASFWVEQVPYLLKYYGNGITEDYKLRLQKIQDDAEWELRQQSDRIGISSKFL